jgi:hypothetical protein
LAIVLSALSWIAAYDAQFVSSNFSSDILFKCLFKKYTRTILCEKKQTKKNKKNATWENLTFISYTSK